MDYAVTVYLIRHARTKSNEERRYLGWSDEEILPIQKLPIINRQFKVVFGSDLKRCQQTSALYFPQAKFVGDCRFRESNFGDFEGKTYEELKDNTQYRSWIDDPYTIAPPFGETLEDLIKRSKEAFKELPKGMTKFVLILHGGTIRALLVQLAPKVSAFWDWKVSHDHLFKLQWANRKDYEEGARCTSLSVVPITENVIM